MYWSLARQRADPACGAVRQEDPGPGDDLPPGMPGGPGGRSYAWSWAQDMTFLQVCQEDLAQGDHLSSRPPAASSSSTCPPVTSSTASSVRSSAPLSWLASSKYIVGIYLTSS